MSSDKQQAFTPDNINYAPVAMYNGRYRMRQLTLNNIPISSVAFTATGSQLLEIKIPANTIFNPARSTFSYQLVVPAQGAGAGTFTFEDTFEICNSIQFGTAAQPGLFTDLNFASNYISIARKIDTNDTDFESLDYTSGLYCSGKVESVLICYEPSWRLYC